MAARTTVLYLPRSLLVSVQEGVHLVALESSFSMRNACGCICSYFQDATNGEWDTLSTASTVAIDDVNAGTSAQADAERKPLPTPVDKEFEKRLLKANGFAKFQLALPARLADQCDPQEVEELDAEIRAVARAHDQRYPPVRSLLCHFG